MKGRLPSRETNWKRLPRDPQLRANLQLRHRIFREIRRFFDERGFLEIDVPVCVPLPGMEPHLCPIPIDVHDRSGLEYRFFLHTSPEYCLKKLLSGGLERIYALTHAFRDREVSATHNLEFALLEWYRVGADYTALMRDCEELVCALALELMGEERVEYGGRTIDLRAPWPRATLAELVEEHAGVRIDGRTSLEELVEIARSKGYREVDLAWPWEDVFYLIFLNEVEPHFPPNRPLFVCDYPVQMGALARRKASDPCTVERFELYVGGLELANAFSELTDIVEQRERLVREREQRMRQGGLVYPVDESFLDALGRGLPDCAGIALGVDRLVMLFANAHDIREVLPFPFQDLVEDWRRSYG